MESPVDESGRSRRQGVDALLGEKNRVAGGFGELLDAGRDNHGVTDEGELELAATAEELVDVPTGVDNGRHNDLEQRVVTSDRLLSGVRLGERLKSRMSTNIT